MPAVSSPTVARLSFRRSLLLELLDRRQVGEQADRAVQLALRVHHRRHRDPHVRRARPRVGHRHAAPEDWAPCRKALVDDVRQHRLGQQAAVVVERRGISHMQHPAAGRIENPHLAVQPHDQQPGGEAGDDLVAHAFARLRPGGSGALLRFQFRDGFGERGGEDGRVTHVPAVPPRVARGGNEAERREDHRRRHAGHDGRQAEQRVRARVQIHGMEGSGSMTRTRGTSSGGADQRSRRAPRPWPERCRTAAHTSCRPASAR